MMLSCGCGGGGRHFRCLRRSLVRMIRRGDVDDGWLLDVPHLVLLLPQVLLELSVIEAGMVEL